MASASSSAPAGNGLTPAQRLMQEHNTHQPTVEEVPDDNDADAPAPNSLAQDSASQSPVPKSEPVVVNGNTMSAKAAGKQKAQDPALADSTNKMAANAPRLDTQSEEAFPSLGAPKVNASSATTWGSRPASLIKDGLNGAGRSNLSSPASSARASGASTPYSAIPGAAPKSAFGSAASRGSAHPITLPGRYTENMEMPARQLRKDLRKPYMEILRDINKRSKAKVDMTTSSDFATFRGQGPTQESVQEILKEVAAQIGKKENIKVAVPSSLRAFIIGKQGATIQSISKRSGARVQMPKADGPGVLQDDDDSMVEIDIEGNPIAVRLAQNEIEAIVNQRTSSLNLRLKDVPPEFFPFIAGAHNAHINTIQESRGVRVKVPHYDTWQTQAPPEPQGPGEFVNFRPQEGLHIHVTGDREAARQVQAEIEAKVKNLQRVLTVRSLPGFERGQHQFLVGERGAGLHDFLQDTGCSIVLPPSSQETEPITIIGPPDQIDEALNKAMDLASSMQVTSVEVSRQFPGLQAGAQSHVRDFARYMRHRRALQRIEDEHSAQVMFPPAEDTSSPWKIYTRDNKAGTRARVEVLNLANAHPPTRFRNVNVHPFYQRELEKQYARQLRDEHGVHLVVPEENETESQVLLVYEKPGAMEEYVFPTKRPSTEEVAEFEKALAAAEKSLLELIGTQQEIVQRNLDAPVKYRDKLVRFSQRENQGGDAERYPVQSFGLEKPSTTTGESFPVEFRGPSTAVDAYADKILAFIEEQIRDEAERDYTVTCDFPQKFANVLIGKKGENINKLRDEFDVEIQVKEGQVEVQGPKPKADAAKAHIMSLARKLEDETTHVLKIDPKFHRELIGAKGSQVLKLQDRYNVRVNFPRSGSADDESVADGASDAGTSSKRRGPPQVADEVTIKGPRKGADEAKDELWALYQYSKDLSHTATVSVAQSQLASLIGQGGRELQNLREATGAEIDVPGSKDAVASSGRVDVKLKGRKEAVANAKKIIEARAKTFDETVRQTIEVDKKHHGALIGSSGDNIRQIILAAGATGDAHELGQMVQFPKPHSEESSIRVEGSKEVVEEIIKAIEGFTLVRESHVSETIEVPPERHGALIGRGGQVRKSLETDNNISIFIPSTSTTGAARSQIKLTGMPDDVKKARERINTILNERKGETLSVPKRLHHVVSDGGTFFRILNRELRVTVDHQGQRPPKPEASASPQPSTANIAMPLITDEAPGVSKDLSPEEIQAKVTWEVVPLVSAAALEGDEPMIPWILKGEAESVAKAKALVEAAVLAAQDSVVGFLVLPDARLHKSVIGQGGSTVNKIRKATHCKIDVPKAGEGGAIEIKGAKDRVEEAREMVIEAVLENIGRRQGRGDEDMGL